MPALQYDYEDEVYEYPNRRKQSQVVQRRKRQVEETKTSRPRTAKGTSQRDTKARTTSVKRGTTNKKKNYDLEIPTIRPKKQITEKPVEMTLKKPKLSGKAKQKAKAKVVNDLKTILCIGIFFSLFFTICYRYSTINEEFRAVQRLKSSLDESKSLNGQLEAEIDSNVDLAYIENYAKYQLGMQKPTSDQIEYINLQRQDRIITPVKVEEEQEKNIFEKIFVEIRKILD